MQSSERRPYSSQHLRLEKALSLFYPFDWPARLWGLFPRGRRVDRITHHVSAVREEGRAPLRLAFASDLHVGPTTPDAILEDAFAALREMRPFFARAMPGILARFYDKVRHYDPSCGCFKDGVVQEAIRLQLEHWDLIGAAEFGPSYFRSVARFNEFNQRAGVAPQWYIGCRLMFIADQLMKKVEAEVEVPLARYWSLQLYDIPWFELVDVTEHVVSLNHTQARVDDDGVIRAVVSHRDPGVPNWLDAAGLRTGLFTVRAFWTTGEVTTPRTRVVPVDEAAASLPEGTPTVTPAQRSALMAARRRHLAWRFRT